MKSDSIMNDESLDPVWPFQSVFKMFHSYRMLDCAVVCWMTLFAFVSGSKTIPAVLEKPMALGMADKDVRYHSMDGEGGNGTGTKASSK